MNERVIVGSGVTDLACEWCEARRSFSVCAFLARTCRFRATMATHDRVYGECNVDERCIVASNVRNEEDAEKEDPRAFGLERRVR